MASLQLASSASPSLDILQAAGHHVDMYMGEDKSYPELAERLGVAASSQATVSGISELDYPSLSILSVGLADLPQLSPTKRVPLPPELVEQFGHMQCNCMMGLFPEISRAWLTVDSDIFVWNYEDGGDLAYFDGLSETILCAGLIKPKPNIFRSHIRYLLCLATPVEIVLLAVSFSRPNEDIDPEDFARHEMHLLPESLFSIPSDNTHMLSMVGTDNGRIFMAGKDGCLYELTYQARDGWFSRKCRKVNHSSSALSFLVPSFLYFGQDDPIAQVSIDNSRHIVYTRSEKGTIVVYDLGLDGWGMGRTVALSQSYIMRQATYIARTIDRSNFKEIVHIAAVTRRESQRINLVAITHTGVRLYFTVQPFHGPHQRANGTERPSNLVLVHVRLPPGFTANATQPRPTKVHAAHYSNETLLLCASQTDDTDLLWCLSPDCFPFQRSLMETEVTHLIDSRTWVIAAIPQQPTIQSPERVSPAQRPGQPDPPSVVTQHMQPSARYVLLSSQGSYMVNKLRPVDQLRQLLLNNMGPNSPAVESFFRLHKEDQACATCLILACSRATSDAQIIDWATTAFFQYGGESRIRGFTEPLPAANLGPMFGSTTPMVGQYDSHPGSVASPTLSSPTTGLQPTIASTPFGMTPAQHQQQQYHQRQQQQQQGLAAYQSQDVKFSGKFKGLCLYFCRITRTIWEAYVVMEVPVLTASPFKAQQQQKLLGCSFESDEISWVLEELTALKQFLQRNSQFTALGETFGSPVMGLVRPDITIGGLPTSQLHREREQRASVEAQTVERQALVNIGQLVSATCEVLALFQLLCYHQFHAIAATLTQETQQQLRQMTLRELVLNGKEMCSALITALINRYIGDNTTTDSISSKLREVSPSLYSKEDAICSKASELLKASMQAQIKSNKLKMLQDSLELFKKISQQLNLVAVCQEYHQARFYDGVVDLCLSSAAKRDPQNLAVHYYKNGEPPEDIQGRNVFMARFECYKCITDIMEELLNTSRTHPASPSLPNRPGPPATPDPNQLTSQQAETFIEKMMHQALATDDELFHVALYDWFVDQGLTERLLEVNAPFVEPYIKRATQYKPDNLEMLDLLWKYYEKTRNYPAAAKILCKLAERHSTELTLQQRIEYLSRAVMCAKSSNLRTSSATEGEFLHELEEKLEVSRLQLQVFEAIAKVVSQDLQFADTLSQLNSELMDITKLYGDFADTFDLSECKLAIVHCAGHYDQHLVQALWQEIIEKELEETVNKAASSRVTILTNKLVALGKIYSTSERYFPVSFLVLYLEKRSCEQNWDLSWVFKVFLSLEVPLTRLYAIYDQHFKAKDPFWQTARSPLHLLQVISALLRHFCETPAAVVIHERRHFITVCLDAIASYKVELEATAGMPDIIRNMLARFKQLQAQLDRMLLSK